VETTGAIHGENLATSTNVVFSTVFGIRESSFFSAIEIFFFKQNNSDACGIFRSDTPLKSGVEFKVVRASQLCIISIDTHKIRPTVSWVRQKDCFIFRAFRDVGGSDSCRCNWSMTVGISRKITLGRFWVVICSSWTFDNTLLAIYTDDEGTAAFWVLY